MVRRSKASRVVSPERKPAVGFLRLIVAVARLWEGVERILRIENLRLKDRDSLHSFTRLYQSTSRAPPFAALFRGKRIQTI
jgi:hypothetical protein